VSTSAKRKSGTEDKKRNSRMGRVTAGTSQLKEDDLVHLLTVETMVDLVFYELLSSCVLFPWRERSIGVETK